VCLPDYGRPSRSGGVLRRAKGQGLKFLLALRSHTLIARARCHYLSQNASDREGRPYPASTRNGPSYSDPSPSSPSYFSRRSRLLSQSTLERVPPGEAPSRPSFCRPASYILVTHKTHAHSAHRRRSCGRHKDGQATLRNASPCSMNVTSSRGLFIRTGWNEMGVGVSRYEASDSWKTKGAASD